MKKNRFIFILIIVLAIVAIILVYNSRKGTLDREMSEFAVSDTTAVTRIFMADMSGNKLLLTKIWPGDWTVNDKYKASTFSANLLLKTMMSLAVKAPVSKAGYNNVIKQLAVNSVKVEVYQQVYRINLFNSIRLFPHEKLTKVYYVGSATPDNMGTFMLMEGSKVPFIVYQPGFRGFVAARYSARLNDWRDHSIFHYQPSEIRSIEVEFPQDPSESYIIDKFGSSRLELKSKATNQKFDRFDTIRVVDLINAYKFINFESLLDGMDQKVVDSIKASVPLNVIKLTDTTGKINEVRTFRLRNRTGDYDLEGNLVPYDQERLYALIDDGKEFVLIQYFVFDPISRPLSYLLRQG